VKFRGAEIRELYDGLPDGEVMALERDPENPYDPNAVKVLHGAVHVGFVPKEKAPEVGSLLVQERVTETLKGVGNVIRIYYTDPDEAPAEAA
jgi:hypothetical protein